MGRKVKEITGMDVYVMPYALHSKHYGEFDKNAPSQTHLDLKCFACNVWGSH